jgi:1-deoxy-D-xylulose-5-phosphate reductoisomerase
MIELIDGSIIAQLGVTDMKHAIQYALTYPARAENCLAPLDFARVSQLTFEEPDTDRFPCLALAYAALRAGGTMPAVLNAANEIAVAEFLAGRIRLSEIAAIIESVMDQHSPKAAADLETIVETDAWARSQARAGLDRRASA